MISTDKDTSIIRGIRLLHSSAPESYGQLRSLLEDSIKGRYGIVRDLSPYLQVPQELTTSSRDSFLVNDDSKACSSSDNELELDLLKEDLMCVVCKGMGVGARNRLVECSDCHNLYHQECHDPSITEDEIESSTTWACSSCKDLRRVRRIF